MFGISLKEKMFFARHMSIMSRSGMQLLDILKIRSDIFYTDKAFLIEGELENIEDQLAGLYLLIPINQEYDALKIAEETGLFTTDCSTFYMNGEYKSQKFIRISLGTEPMTEKNINRMIEKLRQTNS